MKWDERFVLAKEKTPSKSDSSLFFSTVLVRLKNPFIQICFVAAWVIGIIVAPLFVPAGTSFLVVMYAVLIMSFGWMVGYILTETLSDFVMKGINPFLRHFITGIPGTIFVAIWSGACCELFFGYDYSFTEFMHLVLLIAAIGTFTISAELYGFNWRRGNPVQGPSPFLKRLSIKGPVEVHHVEAQDHYLKVSTNRSTEFLRCRMSDAVNELRETEGMQIHRSHWIALSAIDKYISTKDAAKVVLKNGETVPVSRNFRPKMTALKREMNW